MTIYLKKNLKKKKIFYFSYFILLLYYFIPITPVYIKKIYSNIF